MSCEYGLIKNRRGKYLTLNISSRDKLSNKWTISPHSRCVRSKQGSRPVAGRLGQSTSITYLLKGSKKGRVDRRRGDGPQPHWGHAEGKGPNWPLSAGWGTPATEQNQWFEEHNSASEALAQPADNNPKQGRSLEAQTSLFTALLPSLRWLPQHTFRQKGEVQQNPRQIVT